MIAYFDTSAIVPLLIDEPGSEIALTAWLDAESVVSTRLLFAEAGAALAHAARLDRLTPRALDHALGELDGIWSQLDLVEIDDALVHTAASLARKHSLRGYDAVHCSAVLRIAGPDTVAVAGDTALISAWRAEGLHVIDTRVRAASGRVRPGNGSADRRPRHRPADHQVQAVPRGRRQ